MKTIWKWEFSVKDKFTIDMPVGAKVLAVQTQAGVPCFWALVDSDAPRKMRTFRVYGTGHPCPDAPFQEYIGTFQLSGGALVFHLFAAGVA